MKPFMLRVISMILFAQLLHQSSSADTLNLSSYEQTVMKNSPDTKIAQGFLLSSQANLENIRSRLLPQVGASTEISRSNPGINAFSAGINAQQRLFDFGKTRQQYQASEKSYEAARVDFETAKQTAVLAARSAYFGYLLSLRLLSVNEDALRQAQAHYDQAKVLVEVGKQAAITVTKAGVDVANARVNLIHAENAIRIARVQLETVAGKQFSDPLVITDSLAMPEDSFDLEAVRKTAFENRPDLLAAKNRTESARMQLAAAKAAYFPSLDVSGGYLWHSADRLRIASPDWQAPGWNIAAGLNIPVFQGGANRAAVRSADASFGQSFAVYEKTRLSIGQSVQQYYLEKNDARQRIAATELVTAEAEEALRMTQERYRTGLATSLEIMDAEVTTANARTSHIQAQYDYRMAHARLLFSMGVLHE